MKMKRVDFYASNLDNINNDNEHIIQKLELDFFRNVIYFNLNT